MITDENSTAVNEADPVPSIPENTKEESSNILESKVFQHDGNQDCLNMGSNGQLQNLDNQHEGETVNEPKADDSELENLPVNAEHVSCPESENEKLIENDPKILANQNNAKMNFGSADEIPEVSNQDQPNENSDDNQQEVVDKIVSTPEYGPNVPETYPNVVKSNFIQNSNMEVKRVPISSEEFNEQQNMESFGPNKNGAVPHDDQDMKNLNSSTRKQNLPKRALRDRKSKMPRDSDSTTKCHLCEKNSFRCTLIPCTKGGEDCEIYFCNICIKKFNQSLSEDDYYNGIECPVCQGICSCEKCKKSVLEEDFKKIMESMHALEDSRKSSQQIAQNEEEGGKEQIWKKKEINPNKFPESYNYNQYAGICTTAQDGVRLNTMTYDSKYYFPMQSYSNGGNYQAEVKMENDSKIKLKNQNLNMEDDNHWNQSKFQENMDMQENEEDESYQDKNQDGSSYDQGNKQQIQLKKKRGRKRKVRGENDGSTESEPDLFNYDRFMKKLGKKTRVHINVRMFALRTDVPRTKTLAEANPKMTREIKGNDKELATSSQIQKYPKNKINQIRKQVSESHKIMIDDEMPIIEKKETITKQKIPSNDYDNQDDNIYSSDNLNMGRYNLRKRGPQKKYYDDEVDFEEEPEFDLRRKMNYLDDYKQPPKATYVGASAAINRRPHANESKYQNKLKRKKRDDDEDYIEDDENEEEEQDDLSQSKNMNNNKKQIMDQENGFSPLNPTQMRYMPQNAILNKYQPPQMQNQIQNPSQNQFPTQLPMNGSQGKLPSYPQMMPNNMQGYMGGNMTSGSPPMQSVMPSANSMAYLMNSQNRANPPPDNSKAMNFQSGIPTFAVPMQQPNMSYMMRMNMMPNGMQGMGMQGMGMQSMPGVYFQQPNQMMRPSDNQNINRMYGQQNFQNKFNGGMGPNKF